MIRCPTGEQRRPRRPAQAWFRVLFDKLQTEGRRGVAKAQIPKDEMFVRNRQTTIGTWDHRPYARSTRPSTNMAAGTTAFGSFICLEVILALFLAQASSPQSQPAQSAPSASQIG